MKSDKIHEELDWYFSTRIGAAGELGAPSTYGAMEAQSLAGAGTGSHAVAAAIAAHDRAIRLLPAAARMRAIADVLHRMPIEQQLMLEHAHRDDQTTQALRRDFAEQFGPVAPVVVALHGREHVDALAAGARRDPELRARVLELRLEVTRAVAVAHAAFWRLACERVDALQIVKRRRLTDGLKARLAEVAPPMRLLTVEDLRSMGALA